MCFEIQQFVLENKEIFIGGSFTIIGVFIAWFLNLVQNYFQNKRDDELYLKSKREELYTKLYDSLMRLEKDIRTNKSTRMSKETKDFYNCLEPQTIWASKRVAEYFYNLFQELYDSVEGYKSDKNNKLAINNALILEFKNHIRKELGIKD